MPHIDAHLGAQIAAQHGVIHHDDLIRAGFSPNTIRRWITSGALVRHHRQTYRLASSPNSFEFRCAAACRAEPSALITGHSAARLWKFRHVEHTDDVVALLEHDRRALTRDVIVRRSNVVDAEDVVRRDDGIRVASPPRAWFDCSRDCDDRQFEKLTEWVLDHHTQAPTLWRTLQRLNQRGRPGLARARRVLSQRPMWQKPADSGLELDVLDALHRAGVPELVRQYPVRLPDKSVVHCDGALPEIRWAVEIDHVTWHGGRFDAQHDKGRDRKLRRVGWQVERVTDQELRSDFDATIAEVADLYRLRTLDLAA